MTDNIDRHRLRFDFTVNLGIVIHLASLLVAAAGVWYNIDQAQKQFQSELVRQADVMRRIEATQRASSNRLMRVETYLSSQDAKYWHKVGVPEPIVPPAGKP